MGNPEVNYVCTCGRNGAYYSDSERKIAETMRLPVEWLHNFMDNWEDAFDATHGK